MRIHTLDLYFQNQSHTIASYLIEGANECFLIESGPASTLPQLLAGLGEHGLRPADVRHLLVTHIHLDHAGAAGWWAQQGTRVYVHQVGAPHLIDPARLLNSAGRIYGDRLLPLWGEVLPAPAENVTALADLDTVIIDGIEITALDTPGHAVHHHVFAIGDVAFTGDAAAVRIPGESWISVPAVPPEFQLEKWLESIDRLLAEDFSALYPTHFGRLDNPQAHLTALRAELPLAAGQVQQALTGGADRDEALRQYTEWSRGRALLAGVSEEEFARYEAANPLYMSVDGMIRYWRKRMETGQ